MEVWPDGSGYRIKYPQTPILPYKNTERFHYYLAARAIAPSDAPYFFQNAGENKIKTVKISSRPAIIRKEINHLPKEEIGA